jgi:uncharacterized protein
MSDAKDAKGQHEPSMEEILASIRRIIAEDSDPAEGEKGDPAKAATPAAEGEPAAENDILELTEVAEEDEAVANRPETPAPDDEGPLLKGEPEHEPARAALPPLDPADPERLISDASAQASVAALSQLAKRPRDRSGELALGNAERTLEDMVRELIRPMLKTWLDENFPQLVERLVRDEIGRLVREAQGH